ncbi:hypothetical protein GCM10022280_03540 [Sphingomonas swuensis]|uniref:Methyl-accepting chemotaxis protein n=1 Tax=Sphingomonas swuensis TaxID=977800 RepID=A0ABP7SCC4_9SPHN
MLKVAGVSTFQIFALAGIFLVLLSTSALALVTIVSTRELRHANTLLTGLLTTMRDRL